MEGRAKPMRLELVSARLAIAFPELGGSVECRMLASGFRSTVVETGGGIVFRIGKNQAAAQGFAREARLLPTLVSRLPFVVPNPRWYSPPSTLFPFGVLGYRKLQGVPLSPDHLTSSHGSRPARCLAYFLVALHSFPVDEATALGVPRDGGAVAWLASIHDGVMPVLRLWLSEAEYARLEEWWLSVTADATLAHYKPVLRHGDLWYDNILVDEESGAVTGVLDFENAAVGDRAQDFATNLHMGTNFAGMVVEEYRRAGGTLDADCEHRMEVWWQLRDLDGVCFAVETGDAVELEDAIHKLRSGPVLGSAR